MIKQTPLLALLLALLAATSAEVSNAETDHSAHMKTPPPETTEHSGHDGPYYGVTPADGGQQQLHKLNRISASGRSREATFDGRYNMESTSVDNDLKTRCAQGSRGLVMLDNATWEACGGKPEGAAKGPGYYPALPPWNQEGTGMADKMDNSKHSMH